MCYVGQELLAGAAGGRAHRRRRAAADHRSFEPLPAGLDTAQAGQPNAAQVYALTGRRVPNAGKGVVVPGRWRGNVRPPLVAVTARH